MDARAEQLHSRAAGQVDTLIKLTSNWGGADLRRPCPGREKLGDGSVGALLAHTADNYQRIAAFATAAGGSAVPAPGRPSRWHFPRLGHLAGGWRRHRPRDHGNDHPPVAGDVGADKLRDQLSTARRNLDRIAELDDRQLDSVPPGGTFRFCDRKRSLAEVLIALLTHQGHQVEALARG